MNEFLSNPQRFGPWMIASLTLFLAGCVAQSVSDTKEIYTYNRMIPIGIVLGGFAAVVIGFFWRKSDARIGWGLMIIVPLAAFLMAPSMWLEHVIVTDQSIEVRSGMFGGTTQSIPFDQVKHIQITEESTGGRRARMIDVLYFHTDAGAAEQIRLANDVKIAAARAILDRANARGIAVAGTLR